MITIDVVIIQLRIYDILIKKKRLFRSRKFLKEPPTPKKKYLRS